MEAVKVQCDALFALTGAAVFRPSNTIVIDHIIELQMLVRAGVTVTEELKAALNHPRNLNITDQWTNLCKQAAVTDWMRKKNAGLHTYLLDAFDAQRMVRSVLGAEGRAQVVASQIIQCMRDALVHIKPYIDDDLVLI